ncbi:hypothetical protein Btru_039103 [Bulinus truncatus]|nr:hypothetical protein Btru_039103 [Bulinus truncatus]
MLNFVSLRWTTFLSIVYMNLLSVSANNTSLTCSTTAEGQLAWVRVDLSPCSNDDWVWDLNLNQDKYFTTKFKGKNREWIQTRKFSQQSVINETCGLNYTFGPAIRIGNNSNLQWSFDNLKYGKPYTCDVKLYDLVTREEPPGTLVTCDEPPETLVTSDEPPGTLVTCDEPPGTLVTCDEPTGTLVTHEEPPEELVTHEKPSDELTTHEEPPEKWVTQVEPPETLVNQYEPPEERRRKHLYVFTAKPANITCYHYFNYGANLNLSCTVKKTFPEAICNFRIKQNGTEWNYTQITHCSHQNDTMKPMYYTSSCSLTIPAENFTTAKYEINLFISPNISGANNSTEADSFSYYFYADSDKETISCPQVEKPGDSCYCDTNNSNNNVTAVLGWNISCDSFHIKEGHNFSMSTSLNLFPKLLIITLASAVMATALVIMIIIFVLKIAVKKSVPVKRADVKPFSRDNVKESKPHDKDVNSSLSTPLDTIVTETKVVSENEKNDVYSEIGDVYYTVEELSDEGYTEERDVLEDVLEDVGMNNYGAAYCPLPPRRPNV